MKTPFSKAGSQAVPISNGLPGLGPASGRRKRVAPESSRSSLFGFPSGGTLGAVEAEEVVPVFGVEFERQVIAPVNHGDVAAKHLQAGAAEHLSAFYGGKFAGELLKIS